MLQQSALNESISNESYFRKTSSKLAHALVDWSDNQPGVSTDSETFLIGVLPGEGVGPEVIAATINVLDVFNNYSTCNFEIRYGGLIGKDAKKKYGQALTREVTEWCETIFNDRGAILCGPGGERFVYDMRAHFDLYCKYTPIQPQTVLSDIGLLSLDKLDNVDMVVVRENISGLYFGEYNHQVGPKGEEMITHTYGYCSDDIRRIIDVGIRLAQQRRKRLCLVVKPGGIPAISQLWIKVFNEMSEGKGLETNIVEIDNACYQIIASAHQFDVVLAPNMFGDVLSDCAALLLGSRGLSYSGNFGAKGIATYQTGHGAAYDIAKQDVANPIGQILSAAMMLRESFGLYKESEAISAAINQVLASGVRTADIAGPKSRVIGTRQMGQYIADTVKHQLQLVS
jgi:3-isopropylmalate dehydrogenase